MPNRLTKPLLFFISISLGITILFFLTKAVTPPYFSLSPASGNFYVGEIFDVDVKIHTNNQDTDSANIIINYDSADLEVINLLEGDAYEAYEGESYGGGTIELTGHSVTNPYNSGDAEGTFATIRFKALREISTSDVTFDFTSGSTTDCNIAQSETSNDILNTVGDGSYGLEPDETPPYDADWNPAKDAVDVPVNSNVVLHVKDDGIGVDISTVEVDVNGTTYTSSGAHQFSYSGSEADYAITINPESNFDYGETVNVSVDASDLAVPTVNDMIQDNYSFTVEDDHTAPSAYNYEPSQDSTNVSPSAEISFNLKDEGDSGEPGVGVDINSIQVGVKTGEEARENYDVFSQELLLSGNKYNYSAALNLSENFPEYVPIQIWINASDLNGNEMSEVNYSFITSDIQPPYVESRNPDIDDLTLEADQDIIFHIKDEGSGVNIDDVTVRIVGINDTTYTKDDFSYEGTSDDYTITIDPESNFEENEPMVIIIEASDNSFNEMDPDIYAFMNVSCEEAGSEDSEEEDSEEEDSEEDDEDDEEDETSSESTSTDSQTSTEETKFSAPDTAFPSAEENLTKDEFQSEEEEDSEESFWDKFKGSLATSLLPRDLKFFQKFENLIELPGIKQTMMATQAAGLLAGTFLSLATVPASMLQALGSFFAGLPLKILSLFGIFGHSTKRKKQLGIVFDKETRRPIKKVKVSILDKKGKVMETTTTDSKGRYGFLPREGVYSLEVQKKGYALKKDAEQDEFYGKLYTGEPFRVEAGEMVKINIAMEALNVDWKSYAARKNSFLFSLLAIIKKAGFIVLFYAGFLATAISFSLTPSVLGGIFLGLYAAMVIYQVFFRRKSFGTIKNRSKEPVPFAVVSLYNENNPEERLAFTVSDASGRYFLLAKNKTYIMKVQGNELSGNSFRKTLKIRSNKGVVNEDIVIK